MMAARGRSGYHGSGFDPGFWLEQAMLDLFGAESTWHGSASLFVDAQEVRKALRAAIRRIRRRLDNILTLDIRLSEMTTLTLDQLESDVRALGHGNVDATISPAELEVIADLLTLIAQLLGYSRLTDHPLREVVYFQTAGQAAQEDWLNHHDNPRQAHHFEQEKRREIARMLRAQGLALWKIATIMKLSEPQVRDLLRGEEQDEVGG